MVEDARYRQKVWIESYYTPSNALDDDGNALGVQAMYENPDYLMTLELKAPSVVDVIIAIEQPESTPLRGHDKEIIHYEEKVPLNFCAVDKNGVTATKAIYQVAYEVRRVAQEYWAGSYRSFDAERPTTKNLGSLTLHGVRFLLNYVRAAE